MKYETTLPKLYYNSTSVIDVQARESALDSYTAITLSDRKRRYFTGTLTVDKTVTGVGGLDITPLSTDRWYQLFLVPSDGDDDQLDVLASLADASDGPSTGEDYRYIGSAYMNSSSQWNKFYYTGSTYHYVRLDTMPKVRHRTAMTSNTWYSYNWETSGAAPTGVVSMFYLSCHGIDASTNNRGLIAVPGTSSEPGWTPSHYNGIYMATWGTIVSTSWCSNWHGHQEMGVKDGDDYIWLAAIGGLTGGELSVGIRAYVNKYLEE